MKDGRVGVGGPGASLAVWSFLWASAILFSFISNPGWFVFLASSFGTPTGLREASVALLALLAVLRPGSMPLLLVLGVAQIIEAWALLPDVVNHRLILTLGNAGLVVAILGACRKETTLWPSPSSVQARVFPVARWLLLFVYGFAFFAKLNGDFFDPRASCAGQFYGKIVWWLPGLPEGGGVTTALVWATVAIEGALPVMLVIPRLRKAGVVLGLIFHLALAFDLLQNLVNFSAVMTALLVLFVQDRSFARVAERWGSFALYLPRVAGVAFVGLAGLAFAAVGSDSFAVPYYVVRQVIFVAIAGTVLIGVIIFGERSADERVLALPRSPLAWLVLAAAVVNGLSPYLGLKTRTAFSMYSNLRMESEGSNHFLVPRSLDALGILSDSVRVLRTNDTVLSSQSERSGSRITWFEFSSYVNRKREIEVWYERGGTVRYLNAKTEDGMPRPPPWFLRKVLIFGPVGGKIERECLW